MANNNSDKKEDFDIYLGKDLGENLPKPYSIWGNCTQVWVNRILDESTPYLEKVDMEIAEIEDYQIIDNNEEWGWELEIAKIEINPEKIEINPGKRVQRKIGGLNWKDYKDLNWGTNFTRRITGKRQLFEEVLKWNHENVIKRLKKIKLVWHEKLRLEIIDIWFWWIWIDINMNDFNNNKNIFKLNENIRLKLNVWWDIHTVEWKILRIEKMWVKFRLWIKFTDNVGGLHKDLNDIKKVNRKI